VQTDNFWKKWVEHHYEHLINNTIRSVHFEQSRFILKLDDCICCLVMNPTIPLIFLDQQQGKLPPVNQKFNDFLTESLILDLRLKEDDHILIMDLFRKNIFNEEIQYQLVFEMIRKFSNLVVIKEQKIVLAHRYFNKKDNPVRQILVNQPYQFPPVPKNQFTPRYIQEIDSLASQKNNLDDAIQFYYEKFITQDQGQQIYKEATSIYKSLLTKKQKLLKNLKKENLKKKDHEKYNIYGQLLQANLYQVQPESDSIKLDNFLSPENENVLIKLDRSLTPAENVQAYFKKYKKDKKSLELLKKRIDQTGQEIIEIEDQLRQIPSLSKQEILELIRHGQRKIVTENIIQEKKEYHEFVLESGRKIRVGKNAKASDTLTFKIAKPYDYWFHARDFRGSHVILCLKNKQDQPPNSELEKAASLAAYYSKAKNSSLVPVDITQRRYVRKPRKAVPGFVIFTHENTVMVKPGKP